VLIGPLCFYSASGRFDFLTSASAHLDATYCHTLGRIAIREKLGGALTLTDQSRFSQGLLGNFGAFGQPGEVVETHDLVLDTKDIREPALGDAPRERHLAALELGLATAGPVVTTAGLDSFVALA
jgi:hypothetical protein